MSPKDSATGSVRSQPRRETAYAFFAAATSPASTAFTKVSTRGRVPSAWSCAYWRYSATAWSSRGSRFAAVPPPVTVSFCRTPWPFMPGRQAISYEPP